MGVLRVNVIVPSASNKVRLRWSEPANAADAGTAGNYTVDGGVTVSAAVVVAGSDNREVDLTLTGLVNPTIYTVTVANVRDIASGTAIVPNNEQGKFIWGESGDTSLNGVVETGGMLIRRDRGLSGDQLLGYNIGDIDLYVSVTGANWDSTAARLRVVAGETLIATAPTFTTTNYTITPPPGAPGLTVTGVTLGTNYVDLALSGNPVAGSYYITVAGSTLTSIVSSRINLLTTVLWTAEPQRRRSNFNTGFN